MFWVPPCLATEKSRLGGRRNIELKDLYLDVSKNNGKTQIIHLFIGFGKPLPGKPSALRLPTPPMETPDPPSDTPGASKQVVLTPHDIPRSLRVYHFFKQLWLVLGVKLMEINSNWFSRYFHHPFWGVWAHPYFWVACHLEPKTSIYQSGVLMAHWRSEDEEYGGYINHRNETQVVSRFHETILRRWARIPTRLDDTKSLLMGPGCFTMFHQTSMKNCLFRVPGKIQWAYFTIAYILRDSRGIRGHQKPPAFLTFSNPT